MISKVFLTFFVVVRLVFIRTEDGNSSLPLLQTIQREMFTRTSLNTNFVWDEFARDHQNYHFSPVIMKLLHYLFLMKQYYTNTTHLSQNIFLARPYAYASELDKLQNSTNVNLEFSNILFYDPNKTSSRYVEDMRRHFHADVRAISFEVQNEQPMLTLLNKWMYIVTKGRQQRTGKIDLTGKITFNYVAFSFKSSWDVRKITTSNKACPYRRRRSIPTMMPKLPKLHFELKNEIIDVNAFDAKGKIGFYNDVEQNYQAIRIPFNNEEFAMAVIVPYYGYSLRVFRNFTGMDYQKLLQRVNKNHENVHYRIPIINSTAFLINDSGVSINGDNLEDYEVVCEKPNDKSDIFYRPFFVDRPFGIIIYHEKTSFVLLYVLVRNPSSGLWPLPRLKIRVNANGEEEDLPISSSVNF